jgi:hypothetical protein
MSSQFFDIFLSISASYNDKILRKIRLEIREKFHFEISAKFDHSKIFNSVEFQISKNAELIGMSLPLKQAIIRSNLLSLSKVMNNLVEACIAGNAKNMRNRSNLPRNFSATTWTKKSRLVPKLVLRHALSGNIHLVAF